MRFCASQPVRVTVPGLTLVIEIPLEASLVLKATGLGFMVAIPGALGVKVIWPANTLQVWHAENGRALCFADFQSNGIRPHEIAISYRDLARSLVDLVVVLSA